VSFFGPSFTSVSGERGWCAIELIAGDELAGGACGAGHCTAEEETGEITDRVPAAEPVVPARGHNAAGVFWHTPAA
jgi:hypothetical protein